jgi:single-strand DNA-binding protein
MNLVILIGRLTKDPELRYTPNGVAVAQFDLAVDRTVPNAQGEKETDFVRIVVWQKQAENCANYLKKGRLAAVSGRLQIRSYTNQDGQKRWVTEVVANQVQFLERPREEGAAAPPSQAPEQPAGEEVGGINLDDLPF